MEQNNNNYTELKASMAEFRANLINLQDNVDTLSNAIEKLNKDSIEFKTKLEYTESDVKDLKQYYESIKSVNNALEVMKITFTQLEANFNKHSDVTANLFENINSDINSIKSQIDHLPLLYVQQSKTSVSEFIKLAPGIISIITVILAVLIMYIKGAL